MESSEPPCPPDSDAVLGRRVRFLRVEQRVSRQSLAEALGVSFEQIQQYETGQNRLSAERLLAVAAALNVDPSALDPAHHSSASTSLNEKPSVRLLKAFNRIRDPLIRANALAVVEAMADSGE